MKKTLCLSSFVFCLLSWLLCCGSCASQYAKFVNPFIGATTSVDAAGTYHGLGKTFPGAAFPFGMVQVSPNTITGGDNGSGYSYEHKSIEGFAFTQMSGVGWYGDLGNFLVTPTAGKLFFIAGKENDKQKRGYRSAFDKKTETARAGYYSAILTDYNIQAESTCTQRCGILKFTFPKNDSSRIQIDLARRVGGTSDYQSIEIVNKNAIKGYMRCTPTGGGWGHGAGKADYTVYFYAEFSKELKNYGSWVAEIPETEKRNDDNVVSEHYLKYIENSKIIKNFKHCEGKHIGFFSEFKTAKNETVELRVGISFVDVEGAERNFKAEIAEKSFAQIKRENQAAWNKELSKIEIDGTKEQKIIFYTALYHTLIDPRIVSDIDGRYTGGNGKIQQNTDFQKRTIFSGWDVFRSQMPLQTLINPQMISDLMTSLTSLATESGNNVFERWEFFNAYSGCMIGNPALSVLADASCKNINGIDYSQAYKIALNTANQKDNDKHENFWSGAYSISNTLEHAYTDYCVARLAEKFGTQQEADYFYKKSQNYRNIFDADKGWFRPRRASGDWETWAENGKLTDWYGCIEANPYGQGWFVPHDIEGLANLLGGREKAAAELEHFFENTPENLLWNSYYNHANEPVHHVPFLFNRFGKPYLTQKWTNFVCQNAYKNSVEGLIGNEDVGQMSAWYVLAATGIYQICPANPRFEITTPQFKKTVYHFDNGKTFCLETKKANKNAIYIKKMLLNGKEYNKNHIDYQEIINGGKMILSIQ